MLNGRCRARRINDAKPAHAPVWLIQSNDDTPQGAPPATVDLNAFFDATVPYSSLWEFPSSTESAKRAQLAQLHWTN